jgi:urate oxidase
MAFLSSDSYGKSDVRLTKVTRRGHVHHLTEMAVAIELRGEFARCYTHGDNSMVVPTDTMKNTVYALAKTHDFDSVESFGKILAQHFVGNFSHIACASATIQESMWDRIMLNGKPHPHAFIGGKDETRNCRVEATRAGIKIQGGINGMTVLKTTNSGFVGYIKDQFTTLKETTDRIFATIVEATWDYNTDAADFNACYASIRESLVRVFATHHSLAVQQTLFEMGNAALEVCKQIDQISFVMPNQHRLLTNLQPFGMENANEIFVPTTEPYGKICGTLRRS